jgi:hypothetical protein
MPKKMRRAALFSCLSLRAKEGAILGLENYPDEVKTKSFLGLMKKLPVELGRKITVVLSGRHRGIELSARNIPGMKILLASYLNPEDVLGSRKIVFLVDAVKAAEETFLKKPEASRGRVNLQEMPEKKLVMKEAKESKKSTEEKPVKPKKTAVKKSLDPFDSAEPSGETKPDPSVTPKKKVITRKKAK